MTDIDRLLELKNRLDVYYGEPKEYDETLQEYQSLYEKLSNQEKEIQQLKEIIQIKLVQEELLFGMLECTVEELPKKLQDSKTNAEIVERLKLSIGKYYGKSGYEFIAKELKSILENKK